MNSLEESAKYLELCIQNITNKLINIQEVRRTSNILAERVRNYMYLCRIHVHLSHIFYKMQSFEISFSHAESAVKAANGFLHNCYLICSDHMSNHKKLWGNKRLKSRMTQNRQYKLSESPHYKQFHDAVVSSYPLIEYLYFTRKKKKCRIDVVLSGREFPAWIYETSLNKLLEMTPVTLGTFRESRSVQEELTISSLLDKICLLLLVNYSMSTAYKTRGEMIHSKHWIVRCLKMSKKLMPENCPIVLELNEYFSTHFSSMKKVPKSRPLSRSPTRSKSKSSYVQIVKSIYNSSRPAQYPSFRQRPLSAQTRQRRAETPDHEASFVRQTDYSRYEDDGNYELSFGNRGLKSDESRMHEEIVYMPSLHLLGK
jgi:hypothetical protein